MTKHKGPRRRCRRGKRLYNQDARSARHFPKSCPPLGESVDRLRVWLRGVLELGIPGLEDSTVWQYHCMCYSRIWETRVLEVRSAFEMEPKAQPPSNPTWLSHQCLLNQPARSSTMYSQRAFPQLELSSRPTGRYDSSL